MALLMYGKGTNDIGSQIAFFLYLIFILYCCVDRSWIDLLKNPIYLLLFLGVLGVVGLVTHSKAIDQFSSINIIDERRKHDSLIDVAWYMCDSTNYSESAIIVSTDKNICDMSAFIPMIFHNTTYYPNAEGKQYLTDSDTIVWQDDFKSFLDLSDGMSTQEKVLYYYNHGIDWFVIPREEVTEDTSQLLYQKYENESYTVWCKK